MRGPHPSRRGPGSHSRGPQTKPYHALAVTRRGGAWPVAGFVFRLCRRPRKARALSALGLKPPSVKLAGLYSEHPGG